MFGKKFDAAKSNVTSAVADFNSANARIDALKATGGTIEKDVAKASKDAAKNLSKAHIEMRSARGEIFGSIRNWIGKMGDVVGLNLYGKGSAKTAEAVTELAAGGRAGKLQRAVSKPIRWLAKSPKASLVGVGALAVIGVGSMIRGRAARRTEAEAEANAMAFDAAPAQAAVPQYQISPEEYAAMQARMRGGNGPQTGHADAITAARQATAPEAAAQL